MAGYLRNLQCGFLVSQVCCGLLLFLHLSFKLESLKQSLALAIRIKMTVKLEVFATGLQHIREIVGEGFSCQHSTKKYKWSSGHLRTSELTIPWEDSGRCCLSEQLLQGRYRFRKRTLKASQTGHGVQFSIMLFTHYIDSQVHLPLQVLGETSILFLAHLPIQVAHGLRRFNACSVIQLYGQMQTYVANIDNVFLNMRSKEIRNYYYLHFQPTLLAVNERSSPVPSVPMGSLFS